MKKYYTNVLILSLLTFFITSQVGAFGGSNHTIGKRKQMKQHREQVMKDIVKELHLNPDQQKQLDEFHTETKKTEEKLFSTLHEKRKELHKEFRKDTFNTQKINTLASEIKKLENEKIDHQISHVMKMHKILTPEQRKLMHKKMDEHKKQWIKRHPKY